MPEPESISLTEAAERLGVHYMTAYKYVRTGRLNATKDGTQWRVRPRDLDEIEAQAPSGRRSGGRKRLDYAERLVRPLVDGDEAGAWSVVQSALASGTELRELYLDVLSASMERIGRSWATGDVTVAEEHQASALMQRMIGRLGPNMRKRGRDRGTIVLGAPPTDTHALPVSMMVDLLRHENFHVIDLGADVPLESFEEAVRGANRLMAVGVTVSTPGNEGRIAGVITAIRPLTAVPVAVGGVSSSDELADLVGADCHVTAGGPAIEWFRSLKFA